MAKKLILAKAGDERKKMPGVRQRVRRDLSLIGIVIVIGCGVVAYDPNRFFEWLAQSKAAKVDEFLVAIVIIGTGFIIFSWRRWTDLSRQIVEYKRLQTELTAFSREASRFSETDDLLQSCLTLEEACAVIIRHIESELPVTSGSIYAIDDSHRILEAVAAWGKPGIADDGFATTDCWALRRGRVNISIGPSAQLVCAHISPPEPLYAMCVPMMAQGDMLGALYIQLGKEENEQKIAVEPLGESQERIVKTLAEHLALAMSSLKLRETLRTQSIRDPLTNLFNRRYLEETLEREVARAVRQKAPLCVMMIDVDHFKTFNDSFGHEAGDVLLRELGQLFRTKLRAGDIACRYGGEEFTMVLTEASPEGVKERAEELRKAVADARFDYQGQSLESVTISVGVACSPEQGTTPDTLLRAADKALYRAKDEGRNRVVASS